jgi:hypothetical protein
MANPVREKVYALPLRSKLLDWLKSSPQKIATAQQWHGMLNNLQNIRKEELERSNLSFSTSWLDPNDQIEKQELINAGSDYLWSCQPTLHSFCSKAFLPSLDMKTMTGQLPKRIEGKARRFVEKATNCYRHPSMGYWIVRTTYEDVITVAPNWIVLDHKGTMLNSCWFPSALEAFDAMHQHIRTNLREYGRDEPFTLYGEYSFLGGKNYQEWFIRLPDWPLPYRDTHFKLSQLLVHIRTTHRIDQEGRSLLMVEEIQSPWHADIRKNGSTKEKTEIGKDGRVADAPFSKEWHELAIKAVIHIAVSQNINHIGFTTGKQQCERWWNMKGLMNLYDMDIPKCLNKIATQFDCTNDWSTITTRRPVGRLRRTQIGEWVLMDSNNLPISPPVLNKDIALYYLNDRSTPVKEQIQLLRVSSALRRAVSAGNIPLFGW